MRLTIPEFSLVTLVGVSGAGKSTFAREHFAATEVLSSDAFRGFVCDDETSQAATKDAFDALYYIAGKRLANRRLTVVDATNVQTQARKGLIELARRYHCLPVAIVLDLDPALCQERNQRRPDRDFGRHVVRNQARNLRRALRRLRNEGFRSVHVLSSPEEIADVVIERQKLWADRRDETGPFDIVGDVHGCFDELSELLNKLGWDVSSNPTVEGMTYRVSHPEGRKLVFLGDLVDRGPRVPEVLRLAMDAVAQGSALCVPGNHDVKLVKALRGKRVTVRHGLAQSLEQLDDETDEFRSRVMEFLDGLVSHFELDDGRLVVAHAGMREEMQGRASGVVRSFALYGETTGETDELGLPVRYDWAKEYRGRAMVVYGHTPVPEPEWLNRTLNIDTGCVFGGSLTALRYPEKDLVSVPATRAYAEPLRPLTRVDRPAAGDGKTGQQLQDEDLFIDDVRGRRIVSTGLRGNLTIREENAAAALEAMSRFATDPRWLIYLPPTMAPTETSSLPGLLEHPAEAFAYYDKLGVGHVICEEKHMGSRAVIVACRNEEAALRRFGVASGETGVCITRTGRRFFSDPSLEAALLDRVRKAVEDADLWQEIETDWLCLDCELMPWSAKAGQLIQRQYAPVGSAAAASIDAALSMVKNATNPGIDLSDLQGRLEGRRQMTGRFRAAYGRYCWPAESIADFKLAPFHLMASEGVVHSDKDHRWHLEMIGRLCDQSDELFLRTKTIDVDLGHDESRNCAIAWWTDLTDRGGEGMVIKPAGFIARGRKALAQPALKCRGREYLRIIYGPEYTADEHMERLRKRSLGRKRSLALRELALGLEGLHRFVAGEPLRRVHECVFGVLALESEPVDPRL